VVVVVVVDANVVVDADVVAVVCLDALRASEELRCVYAHDSDYVSVYD
jgi:hypothetical protein